MIIGLIIIISSLFFGNIDTSGAFFEIPDIKKKINNTVQDDDRKKEAVSITDAYLKSVKEIRKNQGKIFKEIDKLSKDRSTTQTVLENKFLLIQDLSNEGRSEWLDSRFIIKELITEEEFDQIILEGKQEEQKAEKRNAKTQENHQKLISEIESTIKSSISAKDKQDAVLLAFKDLDQSLIELHEMQSETNFKIDKYLPDYNATREDLLMVTQKTADYFSDMYAAFITFHFQVIDHTNEEEWKSIRKKIKSIAELLN